MKKNIIFFLVKCELGIPHLKNTSKDIIKLSFFSLILLVFSFTNKAFGQTSYTMSAGNKTWDFASFDKIEIGR